MTSQPLLNFDPPKRRRKPTLTDRLADYLRQRIGQWVPVVDMAKVVGTSGVRQRRLECEQRGLQIQHPGEYRDGLYGFVIVGDRGQDSEAA